ncbi:hypothetical protein QP028_07295 [Corynebacterium suedekumii]|nr:hypothetical protein QP028_07295 [Corynebacterium suedekumii]
MHEAIVRWADDEARSVNAQIEVMLRDALRRAGRLPRNVGELPCRGRPPEAATPPRTSVSVMDHHHGRDDRGGVAGLLLIVGVLGTIIPILPGSLLVIGTLLGGRGCSGRRCHGRPESSASCSR